MREKNENKRQCALEVSDPKRLFGFVQHENEVIYNNHKRYNR